MLAKNLQGDLTPYRYRMLGQVATLGRYKGIADVMGGTPPRLPGLVRHAQLPPSSCRSSPASSASSSTGRRHFFRRDIVELSGLGDPHRLE